MKKSAWLGLALSAALPVTAWGQETPESGPLSVNGGLMIWTLVVFVLLFLVLRRWAWPAILGAVEARERELERKITETTRNQQESVKVLEEQKKLLAAARGQAQALIGEAKVLAEKERALALEKTRQEQEALLDRARRDIAEEKDKAVAELRREAVDLSLAAASKLVGERLDSDTDRKLIQNYLASLESKH